MRKRLQKWGFTTSFALAAVLVGPSVARAQVIVEEEEVVELEEGLANDVGVGLTLGVPFTGLLVRYFPTSLTAFTLEAGYATPVWDLDLSEPGENLTFRANYLAYTRDLAGMAEVAVPLYLGLGAAFTLNAQENFAIFGVDDIEPDSEILNAHVPLGIQLRLIDVSAAFFAQVEPGVDMVLDPETGFDDVDFAFSTRIGIGGAYYF